MSAQASCERCGGELSPEAAYCGRCGARTRRARRLVGLAVRVEVLVIILMFALVAAFSWIYLRQ
ncbi:MAG TPA: hypothetical protein VK131_02700 [Candidatus Acidoferrales bacterium]|nr:hypothetical protein [Candidatus Acidoferrales bacterium]